MWRRFLRQVSLFQGGKNAKEQPPYGADVLRLWVASVDYNSDVLIGDRIISQVLLLVLLLGLWTLPCGSLTYARWRQHKVC